MKNRKMLLPALLSIALVFSLILPASAVGASVAVHLPDDRSIDHLVVDSSGLASAMALNTPMGNVTPMIAAGLDHAVGLKSDGTVVAVGNNDYEQCDVGGWTNITQVEADWGHTVGLKSDGTVVAVGLNRYGQCNVGGWTDIIQVAAGGGENSPPTTNQRRRLGHTVGLKSDGTVVAVGYNGDGQCNVGGWTDIIKVAACGGHTVGLKSDGTVVAVGSNGDGQCDVGGWTNTTQVAAGAGLTVGLKSDGTVVAVGGNWWGECDVGDWTDVIQVAAGGYHTVGLKSDGTVGDTRWEAELAKWNLVLAVPPSECVEVPPYPGGGVRFCFIAIAAYGTPMVGEIEILRGFRDEYLLTNPFGQALVGLYYRVSPPMAEFIIEHPGLKPIVRAGLLPAVAMSTVAVNTTPAEKAAILGLLALVSVALATWATRQRRRGPEYT
jgi:hypothetical protein